MATFTNLQRPYPAALHFDIDGLDLCVVNAIRRASIGDVPTLAFAHDASMPDAPNTGVRIDTNTSALNNEFLAQRLSLTPVHLAEDELEKTLMNPKRHLFSVHVKNSAAAGSGLVRLVTSKDIMVRDGATGAPRPAEFRDALFPPDPVTGDHVLLLRLRPTSTGDIAAGEEFSAQLTVSPGSGSMHARWSPVCQCHLRNRPDRPAVAQALKEHLAKVKLEDPAFVARDVEQQFMTLQGQRHFLRDRWGDACAFSFVIETTCGMRPEYIVFKALFVMARRVRELAARVSALSVPVAGSLDDDDATADVRIQVCGNADDTYTIAVRNEGHTMGNLVQGLLYNRYVRDQAPGTSVMPYIGYHEPHPLDRRIVFKMTVAPKTDVVRLFAGALTEAVAGHLDDVNSAWLKACGLDTVVPAVQEVAAWLRKQRAEPPKK